MHIKMQLLLKSIRNIYELGDCLWCYMMVMVLYECYAFTFYKQNLITLMNAISH